MKKPLGFVWILNQVRTILLAIWGCIYLSSPSSFPFIFNFHANPGRFGSSEQMESWGGVGKKTVTKREVDITVCLGEVNSSSHFEGAPCAWSEEDHLSLWAFYFFYLFFFFVGFLKGLLEKLPVTLLPSLPLPFFFLIISGTREMWCCFSFFRIWGDTLRVL